MGVELFGAVRSSEACHADEHVILAQPFLPSELQGRFDPDPGRGAKGGLRYCLSLMLPSQVTFALKHSPASLVREQLDDAIRGRATGLSVSAHGHMILSALQVETCERKSGDCNCQTLLHKPDTRAGSAPIGAIEQTSPISWTSLDRKHPRICDRPPRRFGNAHGLLRDPRIPRHNGGMLRHRP